MKIVVKAILLKFFVSTLIVLASCAVGDTAKVQELASAKLDFYSRNYSRFGMIEQAAIDGDIESQYILGSAYFFGKGVEINYEKSKEWFVLSAENGYSKAQYIVANHFYLGVFTYEKSESLARYYLNMAVSQGNQDAIAMLSKLDNLGSK